MRRTRLLLLDLLEDLVADRDCHNLTADVVLREEVVI